MTNSDCRTSPLRKQGEASQPRSDGICKGLVCKTQKPTNEQEEAIPSKRKMDKWHNRKSHKRRNPHGQEPREKERIRSVQMRPGRGAADPCRHREGAVLPQPTPARDAGSTPRGRQSHCRRVSERAKAGRGYTHAAYGHSSSSHSVEKVEAAKGPWLEQQVHKTWSLHAVECHSALKRRGL